MLFQHAASLLNDGFERHPDPSAWTYRLANAGTYADEGMGPLWPPLIPTLSSWRTIHGFDALLVLTGSTASANL
jgi:hypothetical protein